MPKGFNKDGTKGGFKKGYKATPQHKKRISKSRKKLYRINPKLGFQKGFKHPLWKGGKTNDKKYILILKHYHPHAIKGYVAKHRLVMEKHIERYLKKSEIVHHIDNNPKNNKINNLMLLPNRSAHFKLHAFLKKIRTQE